jgi:hypothetical protein
MPFNSFRDFTEQVVTGGQAHTGTFRKTSAQATTAGVWADMSTMPGHPVTNFYASSPLIAATLPAREGIQHGQDQSPKQKYLKRITAMGPVAPANLLLIDTLLYYPFIDGDSTDPQDLVNAPTPGVPSLPRYTDGANVKAYVVAQGSYVGGAQFFISYTNQSGVSGRVSLVCTSNTSTFAGTLISSGVATGTFGWNIPLAQGDTGIRSVEQFTFLTANGGIFALVLCKEIGHVSIREAGVPAEKDFLTDTGLNMPEIADGAYLSFLILANATIAGSPFYGSIQVVWG